MYFITPSLLNHAISVFRGLEDVTDPRIGDWFFETFGPGNFIFFPDRPHERFCDYEELLLAIQQADPNKYLQIHKGTPFYYLSWTGFDLRNYEKALYYIDAAISEDIRQNPDDWINLPGSAFLVLRDPNNQVASRTIAQVRHYLENELNRFNSHTESRPLTLDSFIENFVRKVVVHQGHTTRTIISAFYVFLLEFFDRYSELKLRNKIGGSIQPFVVHLFKGGLIFESLLKHHYPTKDNGSPTKTIGNIFHTEAFKNDFNIEVDTSSNTLKEIVASIDDNSMQSAFNTTSKLRNTTGHNLIWDDIFNKPETYRNLFYQELNAIFYAVSTKYFSI